MPSDDPQLTELQRSIEASKIRRAESLTGYEKLRLGADLYDEQMHWLRLAIAGDNPEFTPEQIEAEIQRRKQIVRRIDDRGIYQPFPWSESDGEL